MKNLIKEAKDYTREGTPIIYMEDIYKESMIYQKDEIKKLKSQNKEMLECIKEAVNLSEYAACSKVENQEEFLKDLFETITLFQVNSKNIIEKNKEN